MRVCACTVAIHSSSYTVFIVLVVLCFRWLFHLSQHDLLDFRQFCCTLYWQYWDFCVNLCLTITNYNSSSSSSFRACASSDLIYWHNNKRVINLINIFTLVSMPTIFIGLIGSFVLFSLCFILQFKRNSRVANERQPWIKHVCVCVVIMLR